MKNIINKSGDMFSTSADAIVNTVNCVGVMGKGVALEFKRRWPDNFKAYKRACDRKELRPGKLLTFDRGGLIGVENPRFLINFPTKDHWRSKSKIEYINSGLDALIIELERFPIKSVAIPPLGCGNGGLDWGVIKPLIENKLYNLDVNIEIYSPAGELIYPEYIDVATRMTRSRAIYIKAIAILEPRFGGSLDRLSLQKVAYLLQHLGVPFNLEFKPSLYGPYSSTLKRALMTMSRWRYISGYLEGNRRTQVTGAGLAAADEYIRNNRINENPIEKLSHLIYGYESPYGLELLSTVHFRITQNLEEKQKFQSEVPYRKNIFPPQEIAAARLRLLEDSLLDRSDLVDEEMVSMVSK